MFLQKTRLSVNKHLSITCRFKCNTNMNIKAQVEDYCKVMSVKPDWTAVRIVAFLMGGWDG